VLADQEKAGGMRFAPRILTSVAAAAIGGALLVSSQPPAALAVPPTNDNLSFAETISLGTFNVTGNNIDATLEGGEPPPSCQNNFSRSVWYRHTAAANAPLTASTEVSTFDTVLAVYSGPEVNPSLGDLVPVGCDDDGGAGTLSTLTFSAIAGVTYYFQAASFAGFSGILFVSFGQIPPNDNLAAALPAPPPHAATVNNVLATDESTEPGSCGVSHAVWYKADLAA